MRTGDSHIDPDHGADEDLRSDARANRERLVDAARAAFATHGVDVPLSTIARRAGVSPATLYRRFPTRTSLVASAFAEQLSECSALLSAALADPDAWRGLCGLIDAVCSMQARSRGFSSAFLALYPTMVEADEPRRQAEQDLLDLVDRAKRSGALRADFDHTDIYLIMLANDGVVARSPQTAVVASRRLVAYFLQAARAGSGLPLPPPAQVGISDLLPE